MNPRLMRNSFIYLLIIVAVLAIFFTLFSNPLGGSNEIPISQVVNMAARGDVELIEVNRDKLTVYSTSGETFTSRKEEGTSVLEMLQPVSHHSRCDTLGTESRTAQNQPQTRQ